MTNLDNRPHETAFDYSCCSDATQQAALSSVPPQTARYVNGRRPARISSFTSAMDAKDKPTSGNSVDKYLAGEDAAPAAVDVLDELNRLLPLLMAKGVACEISAADLVSAELVTPPDVVALLCGRLGIKADGPEAGLVGLQAYAAGRSSTAMDGGSRGRGGSSVEAYLGIGTDAAPDPRPPLSRNPPHRAALPSSQIGDYLNGIG